MKILFLEWNSLGNQDMIDAFTACGHQVICTPFSSKEVRCGETVESELKKQIKNTSPDFVFSFNYYPIVSIVCKDCDMVYVSWTYDNPYVLLYSYTVLYERNYIFVFDKELCMEFMKAGIKTVHYLPLAANPQRLTAMNEDSGFLRSSLAPQKDISFVGSLYTEEHNFYDRLEGIKPYTRGYLEGLMHSQMQVFGYNFVQESLTKDIIEDMMRILPMQPSADGIETVEYLYAQYVINRQITKIERGKYLSGVANQYGLDLYTHNRNYHTDGCLNHGPVDAYKYAPYVFRYSKINLNISLRSIKSGIPLRCFDIIGANGFLLTNYQADFDDCFVAGEDYVYYDSYKDMMDKIAYLLSHEEDRLAIKENGFRKISENHTYQHRVNEIMSYLK